ncbi:hypothetical protein BRC89_13900 [Halobacteriales archaeon QS_4_70_19]|jgi:cbb3-type cytochrome oxidase subunit 3|nr:MAG: hypothetical protein BRC89_13900 [Halobacteriales archaeon QS_4_70_19]
MQRQDRSWVVTLLLLVVLAAVAWLAGGAIQTGLLLLGRTSDFASDVGALSATALFVLFLLGYVVHDYVPWPRN